MSRNGQLRGSRRTRPFWGWAAALATAAALVPGLPTAEPATEPAAVTPARPAARSRSRAPDPTSATADAARRAQAQNGGGRVLAVEASEEGYAVKLLKDGDIRIVFVPRS